MRLESWFNPNNDTPAIRRMRYTTMPIHIQIKDARAQFFFAIGVVEPNAQIRTMMNPTIGIAVSRMVTIQLPTVRVSFPAGLGTTGGWYAVCWY